MPSYRLRTATTEDAPIVASVWEKAWPDGHLGHVPEELVRVRTPESFRVRTAERIGVTTVAVSEDDEIAGFVMVVGDEVEQVYVSGEHRGSGVAGLLLTEAERLVAKGGHDMAWLAVAVGNARARRFYERSGWTDGGYFEYDAEVDGGTVAVPCHRYIKPV